MGQEITSGGSKSTVEFGLPLYEWVIFEKTAQSLNGSFGGIFFFKDDPLGEFVWRGGFWPAFRRSRGSSAGLDHVMLLACLMLRTVPKSIELVAIKGITMRTI